jgi:hypothetical protein
LKERSRAAIKPITSKFRKERVLAFVFLFFLGVLAAPAFSSAKEINKDGWDIPNLRGLYPYNITVEKVDGVEKVTEKFHTPGGGQVAKISGNGRVFGYAVDRNEEPPIDYLLIDPDGSGKFTEKYEPYELYMIPEWVSR